MQGQKKQSSCLDGILIRMLKRHPKKPPNQMGNVRAEPFPYDFWYLVVATAVPATGEMLSAAGNQARADLPGSAAASRRGRTAWVIVSPWIGFAFRANPAGITPARASGCGGTCAPLYRLPSCRWMFSPTAGETYRGFAHAKSAPSFFLDKAKK